MKKFKFYVIGVLVLLIIFNLYSVIYRPNPVLSYQIQMSSLSAGDRYFGRLSLWYTMLKEVIGPMPIF